MSGFGALTGLGASLQPIQNTPAQPQNLSQFGWNGGAPVNTPQTPPMSTGAPPPGFGGNAGAPPLQPGQAPAPGLAPGSALSANPAQAIGSAPGQPPGMPQGQPPGMSPQNMAGLQQYLQKLGMGIPGQPGGQQPGAMPQRPQMPGVVRPPPPGMGQQQSMVNTMQQQAPPQFGNQMAALSGQASSQSGPLTGL